jgi:hypothetical protein
MFGTKHEGLRKKQSLNNLSDYITNKQEKIRYPDRSALEKQMKQSLDAHETKAQSTHFRRRLLEHQKVANYQNELDRIRNVKGLSAGAFESRIEKLEKLTEQIK